MTEKEAVEAVTLIVMSYPASFKDENTVQAMGKVWYRFFQHDNAKLVALAVQKHIAINKWPPSIAEVREQMMALEHPEIVPPDIAWAAVADLLYAGSESNYNHPERKLPPLIARTVETIGWSTLYQLHRGSYGGNKDGFDRVAFMDQYKPAYERAREKAMLPKGISEAAEKAERILGAETQKQLDSALSYRKEREDYYESWSNSRYERILSQREEQKLLGGTDETDT